MSHRRTFLKQLTALAGTASIATLQTLNSAFAEALEDAAAPKRNASSWADLRDHYLLAPEITYFNHGSIGTIPKVVQEARTAYLGICETNPWLYMWGGAWEEPRESVRKKVANLLGCAHSEIAITHNTTEGFNLLAAGLPLGPGDEVLFSTLNHPGASVCWHHYGEARGYTVRSFDFPILDFSTLTKDDVLDAYDRHITPSTRALVFPHIDNMVGLRYPVKELAALAHEKGVEFVAVDGAQSVGMIDVDLTVLGVDVYCASPHKWLQAPKGLGVTYVREPVQEALRPLWVTWGQARWAGTARIYEDYGTRNLPEVLTLGDAVDFQIALGSAAKQARYRSLWKDFFTATERAPRVVWRSPSSWERSASLFALEVRDADSRRVFDYLFREHGFVFRAFHDDRLNTLRISPNVFNAEGEIQRFFDALEQMPQA